MVKSLRVLSNLVKFSLDSVKVVPDMNLQAQLNGMHHTTKERDSISDIQIKVMSTKK